VIFAIINNDKKSSFYSGSLSFHDLTAFMYLW